MTEKTHVVVAVFVADNTSMQKHNVKTKAQCHYNPTVPMESPSSTLGSSDAVLYHIRSIKQTCRIK